jgi:hypothetical protein
MHALTAYADLEITLAAMHEWSSVPEELRIRCAILEAFLCAIAHRDAGTAGCGVFWREAARTIGRRSNRSMLTVASTKSVDLFAKRPSVRLWLCRLTAPRRRNQSG